MYQGARPAVKESEASVAIIAASEKIYGTLSRKFDAINIKKCFLGTEKQFENELKAVSADVIVLYVDHDNAFLFKAISSIKNTCNIATLVISKNYDEFTAVLALELGADEYLSSQVGVNELRLRVLRLRKKVAPQPKETFHHAKLSNFIRPEFARDRSIYYSFFTPYEFEVLLLLQSSPGKPFARETISIVVRGRGTTNADRSIDNIIARVRKKLIRLGFQKYLIRAFHSYGYMFTGYGEQFLEELEDAIKKEKRGIQ